MPAPHDSSDLADDPIIIYGAPRSGTTFLRTILSEHPDVFISNETRVFAWAHQSKTILSGDEPYLLSHRKEFEDALDPWLRYFLRDYFRRIAGGAFYWGDKNPNYAKSMALLKEIRTLFPGTHFIHIVRDGRDVVTSLVRKGWLDFDRAHEAWLKHVRIGCKFGRELPPAQYFELRYEDLVVDAVTKVREIFDFLHIPMAPEVVDFSEKQNVERTPVSRPTREPEEIQRGKSEWANLLDSEQQRDSLARLADDLALLGYPVPAAGTAA